ncbi:MAG: hypothetical protein JOZ19_07360 [Rubrobacter sp.]|nr:hypothetical protein [Rubrobacter sp.]
MGDDTVRAHAHRDGLRGMNFEYIVVEVNGWLDAWKSWSAEESKGDALINLFMVMFTVAAMAMWFALISVSSTFT